MGYGVHITRAEHWTDSESVPITLPEWIAYIASDPEMRLDNFAETKVEGHILRYEKEGIAVWTAYSRHGESGNMAWFNYHPGEVVVKHPDEEILAKMRRIAASLAAQVMGDEGELY